MSRTESSNGVIILSKKKLIQANYLNLASYFSRHSGIAFLMLCISYTYLLSFSLYQPFAVLFVTVAFGSSKVCIVFRMLESWLSITPAPTAFVV